MLRPAVLCFLLVDVASVVGRGGPSSARRAAAAAADDVAESCRCVPDQWEGVLKSVEREFDLVDGQSLQSVTSVRIHYDYTNKKFASEDLVTGRLSLADYKTVFRSSISHPPGDSGTVFTISHFTDTNLHNSYLSIHIYRW